MHLTTALTRAAAVLVTLLSACHDSAPEGVLDVSAAEDAASGPDLPAGLDLSTPPPDSLVAFDVTPEADAAAPPEDTVDPTGPCGTFGCACTGNADCLDGLCVEGVDGRVCTRLCEAECPAGYDCLLSTSAGDPKSICVPRHTRLCRPCRSHDACSNPSDPFPAWCVPAADPAEGTFCATSCASRPCPDGYACDSVAVDGASARLCVPTSGLCSCRPAWADFGLSTACRVENALGACVGSRGCGPSGLTSCEGPAASLEVCDAVDNDCDGQADNIAPNACELGNIHGTCLGESRCGPSGEVCVGREPGPELCNGADDDCDGALDEDTCDDGLACTVDACTGSGVCDHALRPGFCRVGAACWAAGEANPANPCEICAPASNPGGWSQTPDTCVIAGRCVASGAINPANPCQRCAPGLNAAGWSTTPDTCTIGGTCQAAGQANPARPCEICQPAVSAVTWTQASSTCNIGGTCYAAGVAQPGQPCFVCDPARSVTSWSPATAGTSCDDGNACSPTSTCDGAGVCSGDTRCDDGVACTTDTCTATGCDNSQVGEGWCRIGGLCVTPNAANPANQCQACLPGASQASRTTWSNKPASATCNDGDACTLDDRCSGAGTCTSGAPKNCSDGLSCTTDSCSPRTGSCSSALAAGNCLIGGTCFASEATQPNNVCYKCSTSATNVWSFNNGATCNDGNACTASDSCASGACRGTDVVDSDEPNNADSAARDLGAIDDSAGLSDLRQRTATLYPVGDTDFFHYRINDRDNIWNPRPHVTLGGIPANANYDVCVYFKCDNPGSGQSVSCEEGSSGVPAGLGLTGWSGCCSRNAGTAGELVQFQTTCQNKTWFGGANNETGTVLVRVFLASGSHDNACTTPYTLRWGNK
jgi:hypothetical protein